MTRPFFVLGAPDPEMAAIEDLLVAAGAGYGHAMAGGRRVHPGNAYKADDVVFVRGEPGADDTIVRVECGGAVFNTAPRVVIVDHHNPGDPGYGRPPEKFLEASSVGQVVRLLAEEGMLPQWPACGVASGGPAGAFVYIANRTGRRDASAWSITDDDQGARIPLPLVLAAAADHCLAAAYAGRCPGVDPDVLMRWRAEVRAEYQGRSVEDLLKEVHATMRKLERIGREQAARSPAYAEECAQERLVGDYLADWRTHGGVLDLGDRTLPELPEAAARLGVAYVATVTERDGQRKRRVLGGATTPDIVRAWMSDEGARLDGTYGDPERGFAGGYLRSGAPSHSSAVAGVDALYNATPGYSSAVVGIEAVPNKTGRSNAVSGMYALYNKKSRSDDDAGAA